MQYSVDIDKSPVGLYEDRE